MKLPANNQEWAQEVIAALKEAWVRLEKDSDHALEDLDKRQLYSYAPELAAVNRGITDSGRIREMVKYARSERMRDFELDSESVDNYGINFLLAYLDALKVTAVINDKEIDGIMEYLIDHYPHDIDDEWGAGPT